jgi:hypothetical protein
VQIRDIARLGASVFGFIVISGAVLMLTALLFDGQILQSLFFGKELPGGFGVLWERGPMRPGFMVVLVGIAGFTLSAGSWWVLTSLEGGDDIYWWSREREATRILAEKGVDEPTDLQIARVVLELEESDQGWRPDTMLRFLRELSPEALTRSDRTLVDRLRADVKSNHSQIDRTIQARGGGVDTVLMLSGQEFVAIELAGTLNEVLREMRRVDGYIGANPSTPVPVRRR